MKLFCIKGCVILFISSLSMSCVSPVNEIGQPYKGWEKGEFDIHHIYTGRGESNFLIFPDATSMLIDAGDWDPKDYDKMCELLPDSSRRSGEWIARYIRRVNPFKNHVDYLVVSHFHNDHIGDCTNKARRTTGRNPDYVLTGIAETGE
ncbi:MAG: MBL fold metallo-hydrolase, partial [Mangrovibacterium sp.]|nr:MBL fold metallo-hydrolase [Mangrovibacterium sp.]